MRVCWGCCFAIHGICDAGAASGQWQTTAWNNALAIAGGVIIAALRGDPARAADRFARFLLSARDIAAGGAGRLAPEEN